MTALNLSGRIPRGSILLEASAGTGKTFALTTLIARSLAEGLVKVDNLLVVTFTRATARELRDKVRDKINEATTALRQADGPTEPWISPLVAGSATERAERLAHLQAAAIDLDRAWITTIHGFCRQALQLLGAQGGLPHDTAFEGDSSKTRRQAVRDAVLVELLHQPDGLAPEPDARYKKDKTLDRNAGQIEALVDRGVKHALQNRGTNLAPDPSWGKTKDLTAGALRWSALVRSTIDEITERRWRSGNLDFDDLITLLDDALNDQKIGNAAVRSLRTRFRMVFVDEFQDTDTLQWKIFERACLDDPSTLGAAADVFVVGDPKQAIYRFRGADVDAYLAAARTAGAASNRYDLDINYRSVGDLITIHNHLYRGAVFGNSDIKYLPVKPAPNQPPTASSLPAMTVRWMMPNRIRKNGNEYVRAPESEPAVLTDLANEVTRLLSNHTIDTDKGPRFVKAGDIAILVSSHSDAELVVEELRERGIPVIRTRTGSVLESPVVRDLQLLLEGMGRPWDLPSVRAAAISRFIGATVDDLLDDDVLVDLQGRLGRWSEVTRSSGPYGLLQQLRADSAVLDALVVGGDGTRHLTDLEHVIELLHTGCNGAPAGPDTLMRVLNNLIAEADDDKVSSGVHSEEVQRRIATDEESVQVSTIHVAKGLEYPIVLLPFPAKSVQNRKPWSYLANKERWLDVAPLHDWKKTNGSDHNDREQTSKKESDGDEQRKLYVALTRAKHSVVAWWRPIEGVGSAGLTRLLFGQRSSSGDVNTSQNATIPSGANLKTHFSGLKTLTGGLLKTEEVSISVTPLAPGPNAPPPAPPGTPASVDTSNFTDPAWQTWSFSEVARATQRRFKDPAPPTGGADEPPRQTDRPPVPSSGLSDMPAGPDVGTFLHEVIEKVNFRSPSIQDDLVKRLTGAWQLGTADPESVANGLVKAMETPLAPTFSGTRLLDVEPDDRLDELIFDLRLADTTDRVAMAEVCRTVPTASSDDPYSSYFADLADRMDNMNVAGHLTGSIDLVLRLDGPRFLVVDYKSNRAHPPGDPSWLDHYEEASLREEMIKHDYPLQAFLYSVALHRYLRWRLPDYDPSTHLAGSAYLFLRGMVGPPGTDGRTTGVTCWRPPIEAILSADRILAGDR